MRAWLGGLGWVGLGRLCAKGDATCLVVDTLELRELFVDLTVLAGLDGCTCASLGHGDFSSECKVSVSHHNTAAMMIGL